MVQFTLKTRDGSAHAVEASAGRTLMEAIRDVGFDELMAMCGGCCSCATCHVYIDSLPAGTQLPDISIDEGELLEASDYRCPNSRLSCQIPLSDTLSGMIVVIAPED